jgi:putative restriction endonuclease
MDIYSSECALCEISEPTLLVTSHISRWADDVDNRLNPSNAILLCSLHDRAFERHLIEIRDDMTVELAPEIVVSRPYEARVLAGTGSLRSPREYRPDTSLLKLHRDSRQPR